MIPNAIDTSLFVPTDSPPDSCDEIVIVVMSRLVYRKGALTLNIQSIGDWIKDSRLLTLDIIISLVVSSYK